MIRRMLSSVAAGARFAAAALAFVAAARFAAVAVGDVLEASSSAASVPRSTREASGSLLPRQSEIFDELKKLQDRDRVTDGRRDGGRPSSLRVTIAVSTGPPRSEVYVNGGFVGHSPFVGDLTCKQGGEIKVELVPGKGPPLSYVRTCDSDTIRITD